MAEDPNSIQIGGNHYHRGGLQHWDLVAEHNIPYLLAVPVKYLTRWRDKGGVEDLRKAEHFLHKAMEVAAKPDRKSAMLRDSWLRVRPEDLVRYAVENQIGELETDVITYILQAPELPDLFLKDIGAAIESLQQLIAREL
jgi:hypothetical protein